MLLVAFISLFILLVIVLLFTPINLCLDTATNEYYLHYKGFAKASFVAHKEEILRIKLKIFFWKKDIYPIRFLKSRKSKQKSKSKSRKFISGNGFRKGLSVLKSFEIKRLAINIDTGDVVKNAKLYPIFTLLNYKYGSFNINFEGRNQLALYVQNRPIHIIKSFINLKN
jgi:hypothetical protein